MKKTIILSAMLVLLACPLFFSGDKGAVDDFTRNILCNTGLIAINQDRLEKCAEPVKDGRGCRYLCG